MKKVIWLAALTVIVTILVVGVRFLKPLENQPIPTSATAAAQDDNSSYWTCPMHPQIHADKPGECPICHMKLVQIKTHNTHSRPSDTGENRAPVLVSPGQIESLGIQRTLVEKMNLTAHIPVAGRFLSPTTIAFQVYESDLRHIKRGLIFTGESGLFPESDIQGTISSVDAIIDPTSRTVRVIGSMTKGPKGILSETTFRGDIAIELKDVIGIPESSVLHTGNGDLVYLIHDGGHLVAQAVKLGLKTESYYEVLKGLKPNEFISSGPNFLIDSEAKIRGVGSSGHTHH